MKPSYDLYKPEDRKQFWQDCRNAMAQCPQNRNRPWAYDEKQTSNNLFWNLFHNDTLWQRGYSEHLSAKAKNTFDRWYINRSGCLIDSYNI